MIIVSQDKRMIINFDNIVGIVIRKNTDENLYQVQCKSENEKNKRILGKYKTEERAKEVLQRIATAIAYDGLLRLPKVELKRSVSHEELMKMFKYEMPEE